MLITKVVELEKSIEFMYSSVKKDDSLQLCKIFKETLVEFNQSGITYDLKPIIEDIQKLESEHS